VDTGSSSEDSKDPRDEGEKTSPRPTPEPGAGAATASDESKGSSSATEVSAASSPAADAPAASPQATDPPAASPPGPDKAARARHRLLRVAVFAAVFAIGAYFVLPKAPHGQNVRIHLGSGSSRIVRATARIGRGGNWDRETTWRFDQGAPPAIPWRFELPNGEADIEVELASSAQVVARAVHVKLSGDETSVELGDTIRGLE
jgi:hypothetical protein